MITGWGKMRQERISGGDSRVALKRSVRALQRGTGGRRTSSSGSSSSSTTVAPSSVAVGLDRPSRPTTGKSKLNLRMTSSCDELGRGNMRYHAYRPLLAGFCAYLLLIRCLERSESCILVESDRRAKPRRIGDRRQECRRKREGGAAAERHKCKTKGFPSLVGKLSQASISY